MRKYYNDVNEDYELGYEDGRRDALRELNEESTVFSFITIDSKAFAKALKPLIKGEFHILAQGGDFVKLQPLAGGSYPASITITLYDKPRFEVTRFTDKKTFKASCDTLEDAVDKVKEFFE